jgi:inner membrane protein involved in colicin E2 resistance
MYRMVERATKYGALFIALLVIVVNWVVGSGVAR